MPWGKLLLPWDRFWTGYMQAYLERDARDLIDLKNERRFFEFMVAAARTGRLFNASSIANAIDVDHKTVQSWASILQASGIARILHPFWPNVGERLTKAPKLYFMDTGLVCNLTRWNTPGQLRNGAVAGHVFETFVVSEALEGYMDAGADMRGVWFCRDAKKREIGLVMQEGRVLHPVEAKTGALIGAGAVKNFKRLEGLRGHGVGFGRVICRTNEPCMVARNVQAVPVWAV